MTQALLLVLSGSAIWLVGRPVTSPLRRWGYVLGLAGQPLWLWTSWQAGQWGILALSVWYTWAWADGVRHHWSKA